MRLDHDITVVGPCYTITQAIQVSLPILDHVRDFDLCLKKHDEIFWRLYLSSDNSTYLKIYVCSLFNIYLNIYVFMKFIKVVRCCGAVVINPSPANVENIIIITIIIIIIIIIIQPG